MSGDPLDLVPDLLLNPNLLPSDSARTQALRTLRRFISLLRFRRRGSDGGNPIEFRIGIEDIHIEQPDDPTKLKFPAIGVVSSDGDHEEVALGGPPMIAPLGDVEGPAPGVFWLGDYIEEFALEIFASHIAERDAVIAGLQMAFLSSSESASLVLKIPNYFGATARFSLLRSQVIDETEALRGIRRALLSVRVIVPELISKRLPTMKPQIQLNVCTSAESVEVQVTTP